MARSYAAVKRPPAPTSSWPSPPAPAGGFARRPSPPRVETAKPRPAAVDLDTPGEGAVEGDRRRGRWAQSNAAGRYEPLARVAFDDGWQSFEELPPFKTTVTIDSTRKIITRNDSPDISFDRSIIPYRGCAHGCVYCFARPTHAYLGLSPGLDFETKLFYKADAVKILEAELARPKYHCKPIALGINTDGYQPLEKRLEITRGILGVLARCRHPVTIVTKSALIVRDIDLLTDLARDRLVSVMVSITSLTSDIKRTLE